MCRLRGLGELRPFKSNALTLWEYQLVWRIHGPIRKGLTHTKIQSSMRFPFHTKDCGISALSPQLNHGAWAACCTNPGNWHLLGTDTSMEKNRWRSCRMKSIFHTPQQGPRHPSCFADPGHGKWQRDDESKTKRIRQMGYLREIEVR